MSEKIILETKKEIIDILNDSDDILDAARNAVKDIIVENLDNIEDVAPIHVISSISKGAILAIDHVDSSMLVDASAQIVGGVIEGISELGGDIALASGEALTGVIRGAADVGGDIGSIAIVGIEGAIETTDELGEDVISVTKSAILGAINAGESIDSMVGQTVKENLLSSEIIPKEIVYSFINEEGE